MWYADQDKRPMLLAIFGTIFALLILGFLYSQNNETSEVPEQVNAAATNPPDNADTDVTYGNNK
jgi:hypothetical protein